MCGPATSGGFQIPPTVIALGSFISLSLKAPSRLATRKVVGG
jgi:hypothetical protein